MPFYKIMCRFLVYFSKLKYVEFRESIEFVEYYFQ